MASIPISAKHGVNPTIPICFWCGEQKDQIVLLGRLKGDKEAPMNMIINYEPCDKCREGMDTGISFIEVSMEPVVPNQQPISQGMYPTGKLAVIKEKEVKNIISDEKILANVLSSRKCLINSESWKGIGLPTEEDDHGN